MVYRSLKHTDLLLHDLKTGKSMYAQYQRTCNSQLPEVYNRLGYGARLSAYEEVQYHQSRSR